MDNVTRWLVGRWKTIEITYDNFERAFHLPWYQNKDINVIIFISRTKRPNPKKTPVFSSSIPKMLIETPSSTTTGKERVSFRKEQEKRLSALMLQNVSFCIYGPPGIGKSYCVRKLLSTDRIPFVEVSCLLYSNKSVLIKGIWQEAREKYSLPMDEGTSFYSFVSNLTAALEKTEKRKSLSSEHPGAFYIVLDDYHHFKAASSKIIKKLLSIPHTPTIKVGVILISHTPLSGAVAPEQHHFGNEILPKIRLHSYNVPETCEIVHSFLENEILPSAMNKEEKKLFQEAGHDIVRDMVQTLGIVTNDIGRLLYLCEILYNILLEPVRLNPRKYLAAPTLIITSKPENYMNAIKLLLNDPYAHYKSLDDLKIKIAIHNATAQQDTLLISDLMATDPSAYLVILPKIPSLMLVACYLGNRNPEKTDKRIFKATIARGRSTRAVHLEQDEGKPKNMQKMSMNRLISITQILLSLSEDSGQEIETFDQTIDFYSQLALLETQGLIAKQMNAKDSFSKSKYVCKASFDIIKSLSDKFGIKLNEFLIE